MTNNNNDLGMILRATAALVTINPVTIMGGIFYENDVIPIKTQESQIAKPEDTLSGKHLALMTQMLVTIKENIPIKIGIMDCVSPQITEFRKVLTWYCTPSAEYKGKSLYDSIDGNLEYYQKPWIKEPTEAQNKWLKPYCDVYLSPKYILNGLKPDSPRTKRNVIQAMINQVPRIFHGPNPENIARLQTLVKTFLIHYIMGEMDEVIREKKPCRNLQTVSLFSTRQNAISFMKPNAQEDRTKVLEAIEKGAKLQVKFGEVEQGYKLPGTISVGNETIQVIMTPTIGDVEIYQNKSFKVSVKKHWNYEFVTVQALFQIKKNGKIVGKNEEEVTEILREGKAGKAVVEMAPRQQAEYLTSLICSNLLADLNKDAEAEKERKRLEKQIKKVDKLYELI